MSDCIHARVAPEPCDQTLGVLCLDCDTIVAVCWMDEHIPESLWNRACENDTGGNPCEQSRDDVCAICEQQIEAP
jgi:hypothetical protein